MNSTNNTNYLIKLFETDFSSYLFPLYPDAKISRGNFSVQDLQSNNRIIRMVWSIISESSGQTSSYKKNIDDLTSSFMEYLDIVVQIDFFCYEKLVNNSNIINNTSQLSRKMRQVFNFFYKNYKLFDNNFINLGYIQDWYNMPKQTQELKILDRWTTRLKFNILDQYENEDPISYIGEIDGNIL